MAFALGVDVVCRVIDNLGDAGVCWRFVREIRRHSTGRIRMWIDQPDVVLALAGRTHLESLHRDFGIEVHNWAQAEAFTGAIQPVVVETFGCDLPKGWQGQLSPDHLWVNLEHLSAEAWVADFHLRQTPFCPPRHWFFPGFEPDTGGLLLEETMKARILARCLDPCSAPRLALGLDRDDRVVTGSDLSDRPSSRGQPHTSKTHSPRCWFLFGYPRPASLSLIEVLAQTPEIELGLAAPALSEVTKRMGAADAQRAKVKPLPFVPQDRFDDMLAGFDALLVRGEDSWIRALWSGRPFLWQAYPQSDGAHVPKVEAFIEWWLRGLDHGGARSAWQAAMRLLNPAEDANPHGSDGLRADQWRAALADLSSEWAVLEAHAERRSQEAARAGDLMSRWLDWVDALLGPGLPSSTPVEL